MKIVIRTISIFLIFGILISPVTLLALRSPGEVNAEDYFQTKEEATVNHKLNFETFKNYEVIYPASYVIEAVDDNPISDAIKVEDNKISLNLGKYNLLSLSYQVNGGSDNVIQTEVTAKGAGFNHDELEKKIRDYLGGRINNYGIYLYDVLADQSLKINADKEFPPASISKLPGVILALRDIDAGKYDFDEPIMVDNSLKHTTWDSIGALPHGSYVTVRDVIDKSILESNNTAQYHLRVFLGGMEGLNPRTNKELGVSKFYENPFIATPNDVGKVMTGIYNEEYLSEDLNEYLLNLFDNALPSLKEGVPAGLPSGVRSANKVGFLFGAGQEVYEDAAIIWGEKTDYILVILNDQTDPFPSGRFILQDLSRIVYDELN